MRARALAGWDEASAGLWRSVLIWQRRARNRRVTDSGTDFRCRFGKAIAAKGGGGRVRAVSEPRIRSVL